jgi:hypothetical protein
LGSIAPGRAFDELSPLRGAREQGEDDVFTRDRTQDAISGRSFPSSVRSQRRLKRVKAGVVSGVGEEWASLKEITMNVFPLRHRKFWAVMLAISVLTTLFTGSYFAFLKDWLPLIALFVLTNLITPVNRLQSLRPIYKAMVVAFGLVMIGCGTIELTRVISPLIHSFL